MQAPGCVCGGGGDTGNTHREFPEGSHVGVLEVFTVTSGICKVDSYPLLFKRQAAGAPPPIPPPLVFPIGLGPYQFIRVGGWRASKAPGSRRSERGSGDKADHCSLQLILGALPSPGPLAHRSPSLPMLYGFRKTVICTSGSNNSWPHPP